MDFGVRLKVSGDDACFTRPESKVERFSYPVPTPSAARGILEAIYWKPAIRWVIDRIHVLKPIRFYNFRRNEVADVVPTGRVKTHWQQPEHMPCLIAEQSRQQRAALLLRDVAYVIEAHFEVRDRSRDTPAKHKEMFERRARKGQCAWQPYLGCREFTAYFEPAPTELCSPLRGHESLGWMLHDLDYRRNMTPRFFEAHMHDGIIQVPPFPGKEVAS